MSDADEKPAAKAVTPTEPEKVNIVTGLFKAVFNRGEATSDPHTPRTPGGGAAGKIGAFLCGGKGDDDDDGFDLNDWNSPRKESDVELMRLGGSKSPDERKKKSSIASKKSVSDEEETPKLQKKVSVLETQKSGKWKQSIKNLLLRKDEQKDAEERERAASSLASVNESDSETDSDAPIALKMVADDSSEDEVEARKSAADLMKRSESKLTRQVTIKEMQDMAEEDDASDEEIDVEESEDSESDDDSGLDEEIENLLNEDVTAEDVTEGLTEEEAEEADVLEEGLTEEEKEMRKESRSQSKVTRGPYEVPKDDVKYLHPSRKRAMQRGSKLRCRYARKNRKEPVMYPLCGTGFTRLSRIGLAVSNYFRFAMAFVIFFAFSSLMQGFAAWDNYRINKGPDRTEISTFALGDHGSQSQSFGQGMLMIVQVNFFIAFLVVMRKDIVRQAKKMDKKITSAADFTCHMRKLRTREFKKTSILEYFENSKSKTKQVRDRGLLANAMKKNAARGIDAVERSHEKREVEQVVVSVQIADLHHQLELYNQNRDDMKEARAFLRKLKWNPKPKDKSDIRKWEKAMKKCIHTQKKIEDEIEKIKQRKAKPTGDVFVTFKYERDSSDFIRERYRSPTKRFLRCLAWPWTCCFCKGPKEFNNKRRVIRRAPEPSDLFWENLEVTCCQRFRRSLTAYIFIGILVALNVAFVFTLNYYKTTVRSGANDAGGGGFIGNLFEFIMTYIQAFAIVFVNFVIKKILIAVSRFQRKSTNTDFEIQLVRSLTVSQALNSIVTPLIVTPLPADWYTSGGLVENVFVVVVVNSIAPDIVHLFQPFYRIKTFCACRKKYNQAAKNRLCEPPEFLLAERYAGVLKAILLCLFYGPLMPLIYPITMMGIIFTIAIDYVLLLRVYHRPRAADDNLAEAVRQMMSFSLGLYVCLYGLFHFFQTIESVDEAESGDFLQIANLLLTLLSIVVCLVCVAIYLIFPFGLCIRRSNLPAKISKTKIDLKELSYDAYVGIERYQPPVAEDLLEGMGQKGARKKAKNLKKMQKKLKKGQLNEEDIEDVKELEAERRHVLLGRQQSLGISSFDLMRSGNMGTPKTPKNIKV